MIILKTEHHTRILYKLLKRLARRYDNKGKCIEKNVELLNEISCILKAGEWSISQKEVLAATIKTRLEQYHHYMKHTDSVATKLVMHIINQIHNNSVSINRNFIHLEDYL